MIVISYRITKLCSNDENDGCRAREILALALATIIMLAGDYLTGRLFVLFLLLLS
jgi:hypothetical protein